RVATVTGVQTCASSDLAFQVHSDRLVGIIAEVHIDRQDADLVGGLFAEARLVLCGVSVRIGGDQEAFVRIAGGQGSWVHLSQSRSEERRVGKRTRERAA